MTRLFAHVALAASLAASIVCLPLVATAQSAGQQTFSSAREASQALDYAVQGDDRGALAGLLGADTSLIASGDDSLDQADRHTFLDKYEQMHRLGAGPGKTLILYIGAENWPFPVPLVAKGGRWYFDVDAGREEVLVRRIGENEVEAIAMSADLAQANQEHTPGLLSSTPEHGYYYRVLDTQGTIIAYPAAYRSSGVMTFLVTHDGVVYERDLGQHTEQIASATHGATPGNGWRRVE
jgi:Protein of unknown function (DUF2950)